MTVPSTFASFLEKSLTVALCVEVPSGDYILPMEVYFGATEVKSDIPGKREVGSRSFARSVRCLILLQVIGTTQLWHFANGFPWERGRPARAPRQGVPPRRRGAA
jgi:hypothetical protein